MSNHTFRFGVRLAALLCMTVVGSSTLAADIRLMSAEANIAPEAIAASGLQAFGDEIVQNLTGADGEYLAIAQLRAQLTEATHTLTQMSQVLARDPSDVEARQQYAAAQSQIANLRAEITTARQTLFMLVTTTLSTEDRQKLEIFRLSTGRVVSPAFRVKSRTDAQWLDIERALIAERRAQRLGQPVPSAAQSLLAAVRAEPEVVQAQANLELHFADVQAAFAVAVSPATQPR